MAEVKTKIQPCIFMTELIAGFLVQKIGILPVKKIIEKILPSELSHAFKYSQEGVKIGAKCADFGERLKRLHDELYEFSETFFGIHLARDIWIKAIFEVRREFGDDIMSKLVKDGLVPLIVSAHGITFVGTA